MRAALQIAKEAAAEGEIPVGAVIVKDGAILATGRNRRECAQNALLHAEIEAIHNACLKTRSWRLSDCSLYVTLEPCPMCAGAIINARIPRLSSVLTMKRLAHAVRWSICFRFRTIIRRKYGAAF